MSRLFVFADEAGCFNFSRKPGASRYYIICTISCTSCVTLASSLIELRRALIWEDAPVGEYFHASQDRQVVRDRVFNVLGQHDFSIQATIMEKSKAYPRIRPTNQRFYQYGWFHHFKYAAPKIIRNEVKELQITVGSINTAANQGAFSFAVNDVVQQIAKGVASRTNFCRAVADPCVQAADYCTWAIQKKWERGDVRSYDLIRDRIVHEYDMWSHGTTHQY